MSSHSDSLLHDEAAEYLSPELCSLLAFPKDEARLAVPEESSPEEDEPTVVEFLPRVTEAESASAHPLYLFFFSPNYQTQFSAKLHRYFAEVRERMRQSRQSHSVYFPDSGFQKLKRLVQKAMKRAKHNLAS